MSRLVAVFAIVTGVHATSLEAQVPPGNPYAAVRLLYLIPADRSYRPEYAAAIENAALSLQTFYSDQLGGRTFSFFRSRSPHVETCGLPQPASYYLSDSLTKILQDMQRCWPVSFSNVPQRFTWVVYTDVEHGCNAPGRLGVGALGATFLGAEDLHGLVGEPVIDGCGVEFFQPISRYIGGLGHELGHAFGLPHPPGCDQGLSTCDYYALMWAGYALYPRTYLRDDNRTVLLASTAFNCCPHTPPVESAGDFDSDGRTDVAVFRPSNGNWYVLNSSTNATSWTIKSWGVNGDILVAGDYDGDGKSDFAVFRPSNGTWYILKSSTANTSWLVFSWGVLGDVPVPGDYDGDGKTDVAVYRPSNGTWYVLKSSSQNTTWTVNQWGVSGDVATPGDFDGDGKTDIAVFRPSSGDWFVLKSSTGYTTWIVHQWGISGDISVPGDYDGDGITDMAVFRPSDGNWYLLKSGTDFAAWTVVPWGITGDVPVARDYDGDGRTDVAVYRPSTQTWFLLKSSSNNTTWSVYQWGVSGDVPGLTNP